MFSNQEAGLRPGAMLPLDAVPCLEVEGFRSRVLEATAGGRALAAFFGSQVDGSPAAGGAVRLWAVLADRATGGLEIASTAVHDTYPALTPGCPQAHLFEREIAEQWGVRPADHPWLEPVRFHAAYRPGIDAWDRDPGEILPGVRDFFRVEGEEVHEVAVGPIHAGIIEPGHFRFQCHGEHVFHLEIALGYQHRGVERALEGGPGKRTMHHMETLAGDTTIGHATAYCHIVEALAVCEVPPRAQLLRAVALELERLANHTGDLGALAGDVGFLPTAAYCGRIRGDFLNMTAMICGSRFGRGVVRPGGVRFDVGAQLAGEMIERLGVAMRDAGGAVRLLWETSSVRARFENTGVLRLETAQQLGIVGPAARASGARLDARHDFPCGAYRDLDFDPATCAEGDIYARAQIRWLEMQTSARIVRELLRRIQAAPDAAAADLRARPGDLRPNAIAVACVEGWRGEIWHVAITDARGAHARYKIVDPSFHNWTGLAMAMRKQQISDFPLCNKSFNLSYCGHDL